MTGIVQQAGRLGSAAKPIPNYTITGNAGIASATITPSGELTAITADTNGNYGIVVPQGWSGTITPTKTGYTLAPLNTSYSGVTENKVNEDYIIDYQATILDQFTNDLICFLPMNETSGTTAEDIGGNNRDAVYTNVELGTINNNFGEFAAYLNGVDSSISGVVNISPALTQSWAQEGAFSVSVNPESSCYTNDLQNVIFYLLRNGTNNMVFSINSANKLEATYYSGGVYKTQVMQQSPTETINIIVSWSLSSDELNIYFNGQLYNTLTGIGTWDSGGNSLYIGNSSAGTRPFFGGMSDVVIYDRPITGDEAKIISGYSAIVLIGDSMTARTADEEWPDFISYLAPQKYGIINRAVGGEGILNQTGMADQVASTENDDPDKILIMLGINDPEWYDMDDVKTAFRTGLQQLQIYHPAAEINILGVPYSWVDSEHSAEEDHSLVRAAVLTVAQELDLPYYSTYEVTEYIDRDDKIHFSDLGEKQFSSWVISEILS